MLIKNINTVLDLFMESEEDSMAEFFRHYLVSIQIDFFQQIDDKKILLSPLESKSKQIWPILPLLVVFLVSHFFDFFLRMRNSTSWKTRSTTSSCSTTR